MAFREFDLKRAEAIAGYKFEDRTLLQQALQSALKDRVAATGEVIEDDGNRRLAKLGFSVVGFLLVNEWFGRGLNHSTCCRLGSFEMELVFDWKAEHLDLIQKTILTKEYLSDNAQQKGLHTCLSMSQRQENIAAPPTTMKLVLVALIGAVWLDSNAQANRGLTKVREVMAKLG
jgi:dsRNA-specific ribonuclease